jgi:hypothetical protein
MMYLLLYNKFVPTSSFGLPSVEIIAKVWASWASLIVIVFQGKRFLVVFLRNWILPVEGVIIGGEAIACVLCNGSTELEEDHLFTSCPSARSVWSNVHRWFDIIIVLPTFISSSLRASFHLILQMEVGFKACVVSMACCYLGALACSKQKEFC